MDGVFGSDNRTAAITDMYAELDREKALDVMARYG